MFKDSEAEPSHQSTVRPIHLARVSLIEDDAADIHALLTDLRQNSFTRLHLPFTAAYSSGRKNVKAKVVRHSTADSRSSRSVKSSKTYQMPTSTALQGRPKAKAGNISIFSIKSSVLRELHND